MSGSDRKVVWLGKVRGAWVDAVVCIDPWIDEWNA